MSHLDLDAVEAAYPAGSENGGILAFFEPSTFVRQAAEHRPGKQLVSPVLSPRGVGSLRDAVGARVRTVLDEAVQKGEVAFRTEVADRIVAGFWQDTIGIDPEQAHVLIGLSVQILAALRASATIEQVDAGDRAARVFQDLLLTHLHGADAAAYPFVEQLFARLGAMDSEHLPGDPGVLLATSLLDGFGTMASALTIVAHTLIAQEGSRTRRASTARWS